MSRHQPFALFILVATIAAATGARAWEAMPGETPVEHMAPAARAPVDEPLAAGRVVAVDPAGRITLEYRPIPQLFLEGGTRIFRVDDPASLAGLGPGDKVRFEVERDGRAYTITRLVHSN